jgi:hypothetical protein
METVCELSGGPAKGAHVESGKVHEPWFSIKPNKTAGQSPVFRGLPVR